MNIINQTPYLRTSWLFPEDIGQLTVELQRSYTAIQENVNARTIALFPVNRPALTGEAWYQTKNQRQEGLRQIYSFADGASPILIPHGINLGSLTNFVRIWGTFYDGTNWQSLPYVSTIAITAQITIEVNATNIVVTKGATAPAMTTPVIVLEWISVP